MTISVPEWAIWAVPVFFLAPMAAVLGFSLSVWGIVAVSNLKARRARAKSTAKGLQHVVLRDAQ